MGEADEKAASQWAHENQTQPFSLKNNKKLEESKTKPAPPDLKEPMIWIDMEMTGLDMKKNP